MRRIVIDPITRLEGHGRIDIFLDDDGNVAQSYLQVPELRGFEAFCVGRHAEDMPVITSRICGVCPEAHLLASAKALDALFAVPVAPTGALLRELCYMAFVVADHTTHFYALGGPDLIVGADAPTAERNLLGVLKVAGAQLAGQVLAARKRCHQVIALLGGRGINAVAAVPGGWSKPLAAAERSVIVDVADASVAFARATLDLFHGSVWPSPGYQALLADGTFVHRTHSMGTVDDQLRLNLYAGAIRVVDVQGDELCRYAPADYRAHVAEHAEPWTYLKFPYLKRKGFHGFVDGAASGLYVASPLGRMNASDGYATPLAQAELERLHATLGTPRRGSRYAPVHQRMITHWARLIELLYAAERMGELARHPDVTNPHTRNLPVGPPAGVGIGSVEAPRGTLTHHYTCDARGVLTGVNLIVGTTNNYGPMLMSVRRAAERFIRGGHVDEGILNRVEMAFRLYDPCLACATHALPGGRGVALRVHRRDGTLLVDDTAAEAR